MESSPKPGSQAVHHRVIAWIPEIRPLLESAGIIVTSVSDGMLLLVFMFQFWPVEFGKAFKAVYRKDFSHVAQMANIVVRDPLLYIDTCRAMLERKSSLLPKIIENNETTRAIRETWSAGVQVPRDPPVPDWFFVLYYLCQCVPGDAYEAHLKSLCQYAKEKGVVLRLNNRGKREILRYRQEHGTIDEKVVARLFYILKP